MDNISEIVKLFYLYHEHQQKKIREDILKLILKKMPFGYHPLFFIEHIPEAEVRSYLRYHEAEKWNQEKILFDFQEFVREPRNLMKGSFLVSRFSDDVTNTYADYKKKYFQLAGEFLKLYPHFLYFNAEEKFQKIVEFLYYYKGFHGNSEDYYNPENSFLSVVLEKKKGIPVSLTVLTLLFYDVLKRIVESKYNRKLDFEIYGVNMPGHFLAAFSSENYFTYFDPFNFGNTITYEDCCNFLLRNSIPVNDSIFQPASTLTIIQRMLRNLQNFYNGDAYPVKSKTIEEALKILQTLIQVEDKSI